VQSVIPPGERVVIAGKSQGWRGLAIALDPVSFERMVATIAVSLLTSIGYDQTEDANFPGHVFPAMTTAWEPNAEELAALNAGGKVLVQQLGIPPIRPMSVYVGGVS